MTSATSHADRHEAAAYRAHRDYVLAVLARRCGWLDADEREAALHDAYVVMLEKQRASELDPASMPAQQLRAYLVQTAINKALDEGKRAERKRADPVGDAMPALPDPEPGPEEHAEASQEGARVRELVAELPERQQAIVKLRFFFERTPAEIQDYLGITERTYRRQLERAMRAVCERYELVRAGGLCEERRDLIIAYVAGTAALDRARLAREHLASCRGCASWAAELRTGASRVAAALPVPALALSGGPLERGAEALDAARGAIADGVAAAKHQAVALIARVEPSSGAAYLGGARPGAVAATVAGCIAIAGGTATYCAVEGVPDPIRSVVGLDRDGKEGPTRKPKRERSEPRRESPEPPRPVTPAEPPKPEQPPPPREPAPDAPPATEPPAPVPAEPAPEPPPPDEFGFEASGAGGSASAPAPAPEPQPGAAAPERNSSPAPEPPGEFDP